MSMLLETKGRAIQLLFLLEGSLPDNFYVMHVEIDSFHDSDPVAFNWWCPEGNYANTLKLREQ